MTKNKADENIPKSFTVKCAFCGGTDILNPIHKTYKNGVPICKERSEN